MSKNYAEASTNNDGGRTPKPDHVRGHTTVGHLNFRSSVFATVLGRKPTDGVALIAKIAGALYIWILSLKTSLLSTCLSETAAAVNCVATS